VSHPASTPLNPTPSLRSLARRGFGLSIVLVLLATVFAAVPKMVSADSGDSKVGTSAQAYQSLISAGQAHVCVIVNNNDIQGGVECWGDNSVGQLGNGNMTDSKLPVAVMDSYENPNTRLEGAVSVIALTNNSCVLMDTSEIKCWGSAYSDRVGQNMNKFLQPNGSYYQLAPFNGSAVYPVYVQTGYNYDTVLTGAVSLAGTTYSTCAMLADGHASCWGEGTGHPDVGNPNYPYAPYFVQTAICNSNNLPNAPCETPPYYSWVPDGSGGFVKAPEEPLENVQQISGNNQTTCFVVSAKMSCMGNNRSGEFASGRMGDNYASGFPEEAGSSTNGIQAMSLGYRHGCGLFNVGPTGGAVKCWGDNALGQLGIGYFGNVDPSFPNTTFSANALPNGINNAVAVSTEYNTSCALLIDDSV